MTLHERLRLHDWTLIGLDYSDEDGRKITMRLIAPDRNLTKCLEFRSDRLLVCSTGVCLPMIVGSVDVAPTTDLDSLSDFLPAEDRTSIAKTAAAYFGMGWVVVVSGPYGGPLAVLIDQPPSESNVIVS